VTATAEIGAAELPRRLAAGLLDAAVAALLGGLTFKLALFGIGGFVEDDFRELIRKLILLAAHAACCVLLTAGPRRATLGQRWFGLELAGAAGGRPSLAEAFGRWLAFLAAALPLGAGLLLALGSDRRPFQDRLCDSAVVRRGAVAMRKAA
jgi:uncharacterized RDD family membrane protein YckC